tara:strand:+ start:318 stop:566 length:249 start_codon:yes stop_codon:yes gene_type:complete
MAARLGKRERLAMSKQSQNSKAIHAAINARIARVNDTPIQTSMQNYSIDRLFDGGKTRLDGTWNANTARRINRRANVRHIAA